MQDSSAIDSIDILSIVKKHFTVLGEVPPGDSTTMQVEAINPKLAFRELVMELRPHGMVASLRKENDRAHLRIMNVKSKPNARTKTGLLLLLVTVVVAGYDGFLRTQTFPGYKQLDIVILYVLGIMGIIGIHELGHKLAAYLHKIPSSIPFFIPGIPGAVPTMGAVITSSQPPINRDSLFDLGISGPIAGLLATIVVAFAAVRTSVSVPVQTISQRVSEGAWVVVTKHDIFTERLINSLLTSPEGYGTFLSPLFFASSFGFLITFVNLLPAWQLDGGHIMGAAVSRRMHRALTYASVAILALVGILLMAVLILLFYRRAPYMRPLDDVSPLSRGRKIFSVAVLILVIVLYALTIWNNMFFGDLIRPLPGILRWP